MSITSKLYGGIVEPLEVKAACTWGKKLTLISPCSGKLRESTMFALVLFSTVMRTLS